MNQPKIKTFHNTNLLLLEEEINKFCQQQDHIYNIQMAIHNGEFVFIVIYSSQEV